MGLPCVNGILTNSTSNAPRPEKQVTSGAGARLAAMPPVKSAAPNITEDAAPTRYDAFTPRSGAEPALARTTLAGALGAALGFELLEMRQQ